MTSSISDGQKDFYTGCPPQTNSWPITVYMYNSLSLTLGFRDESLLEVVSRCFLRLVILDVDSLYIH